MVIASAGIILQNKKILLIRRSDYTDKYPGFWGCPAGRSEHSETPEQTAIREVKEETNLDFVPTRLISESAEGERKLYRYLGDWSGEIKIQQEELTDYGWFDYESAIKLNLAFDYNQVIEKLREIKLL